MDQAASIFGMKGCALFVSFSPQLSATPTQFPKTTPPHSFVIANTLVCSDKKVMGPVQYNLRVGELWMACRAICKKLSLPQNDNTKVLKDLMETYYERHPLHPCQEDEKVQRVYKALGEEAAKIYKMQDIALSCLPDYPLTREEVEDLTGFKEFDFDQEFLSVFPSECDRLSRFSSSH
jgi:galactokinase